MLVYLSKMEINSHSLHQRTQTSQLLMAEGHHRRHRCALGDLHRRGLHPGPRGEGWAQGGGAREKSEWTIHYYAQHDNHGKLSRAIDWYEQSITIDCYAIDWFIDSRGKWLSRTMDAMDVSFIAQKSRRTRISWAVATDTPIHPLVMGIHHIQEMASGKCSKDFPSEDLWRLMMTGN